MKSRNALVTGVSGSVGLAIATALAEAAGDSDRVYCQYRRMTAEVESLGGRSNVSLLKMDFMETADVESLPEGVSIVVNSAGLPSGKEQVATISRREMNTLLHVNLVTPFLIVQKYLPAMVEAGFGRIVNINSIWGLRGSLRNGAYSVSKHGLSGLTKSIAKEYAGSGVTCNEICPGPVESKMMNMFIEEAAEASSRTFDEVHAEWWAQQVGGRFVRPEEIVAVALMLCSDEGSGINGASIPVDLGAIC